MVEKGFTFDCARHRKGEDQSKMGARPLRIDRRESSQSHMPRRICFAS